jgi:hypothetical protein
VAWWTQTSWPSPYAIARHDDKPRQPDPPQSQPLLAHECLFSPRTLEALTKPVQGGVNLVGDLLCSNPVAGGSSKIQNWQQLRDLLEALEAQKHRKRASCRIAWCLLMRRGGVAIRWQAETHHFLWLMRRSFSPARHMVGESVPCCQNAASACSTVGVPSRWRSVRHPSPRSMSVPTLA